MEIFLARQPIFDRKLNAVAYELLYRSGDVANAEISDPNKATMQVLVNTFSEIGLQKITSGKPALINITHDILVQGGLPKGLQQFLIPEVLEDVIVNGDVIQEVKNLVDLGYRVALDDFVYSPEWAPLIDMASFIKLDVLALGESGVREQLKSLARFSNVESKLLAEKVETHEEFECYKAMGFSYFQGYFLSRPHVMSGKSVPASQHVILSLLSELSKEYYSIDQVSRLISHDPRLSFKLMRVVNSASFGLSRTVKTIEDTIVLLGSSELKRWVTMLVFSNVDTKPNELLVTALVRAKMCELIACEQKTSEPSAYFTAGLFSMLEALLDQPLSEVLAQMPLSPELEAALLSGEGEMGCVLVAVKNYDEGHFDSDAIVSLQDVDISEMYLQALEWADITTHCMFGP